MIGINSQIATGGGGSGNVGIGFAVPSTPPSRAIRNGTKRPDNPTHLPVVGSLDGDRVHYAFGYTGNGVAPSRMAGRTLASLALGRRDEVTQLPIVEPPRVRVPPEPLRYVGGMIVRSAVLRRERFEEEGRRPGPLTRAIAGLPERIGIHLGR